MKDGRVEQANFDTYSPLGIDEAPIVEVHLVASSEQPGGMGEVAAAAVSPSVTNAIYAAIGRRVRTLPINPDELANT